MGFKGGPLHFGGIIAYDNLTQVLIIKEHVTQTMHLTIANICNSDVPG